MRWKSRDDTKWHYWFAWYPVYLEDIEEWAWLETIYRRHEAICDIDDAWWHYRFSAEESVARHAVSSAH